MMRIRRVSDGCRGMLAEEPTVMDKLPKGVD